MQRNLQWAAGLFEGEGSVSVRTDNSHRGKYCYKRPVAQIKSTDEDVLLTFKQIVIVGFLTGPYSYTKNPEHWKPYWHWQVSSPKDFQFFCQMIFPFLHQRRQEQVLTVAKALEYGELLKAIMEDED